MEVLTKDEEDAKQHLSKYKNTGERGVPMQMYSGKPLYPLDVREEDLDIEDIAHHLSMIARYNGAVKFPYSVAQHSWVLSYLVSDENKFCALMHDTTEAIVGDMIRPIKYLFPKFEEIENNIWKVIAKKYGLTEVIPNEVKVADTKICFSEKKDCLNESIGDFWGSGMESYDIVIEEMSWQDAKRLFLERFEELYNG